MIPKQLCLLLLGLGLLSCPGPASARTVTDNMGRAVEIPEHVEHIICSGSGCLRLAAYLQAVDKVVAVDDIEGRRSTFDARPYALANPSLATLPIFGQFRGHDNPERILQLQPAPQLIFKTGVPSFAVDPDELHAKTGIPVVVLDYGDLGSNREKLRQALLLMGECLGKKDRAEQVICFLEDRIADLHARTVDIPEIDRPSVFIGGVAFAGPHGFQSTEPSYPPFAFIHAQNPAAQGVLGSNISASDVAKEKILEWDPEYLFLDLSTLQMGENAGGLYELRTDPAYQSLSAVRKGKVYGVLPYNWYSQNFESILANAYYIGKVLYPERFEDVDPRREADAIYTSMVGEPIFDRMNSTFHNLVYSAVPVH